jgi:hypothetical protein
VTLPLLTGVQTLEAGGSVVVRPENAALKLVIITGTGCTADVSRVDRWDATAHTTGSENAEDTIPANTRQSVEIDWPYYLITATGGALRYALI